MFGVVSQAQRVQARLKALAQLNIELAKIEGKRRTAALGVAVGLAAAALVLVVYAIGFLLAAAAVGLNEELALWLSLIIVAVSILLIAGICAFIAVRVAKKISAPSDALDETQRTVETVRTHA